MDGAGCAEGVESTAVEGACDVKCYRCGSWPCECKDGCCIVHGDCRDVAEHLKGDVLLTDPPYGIVNDFGTNTAADGGVRRMTFEWDHAAITSDVAKAVSVVAGSVQSAFVFCGGDQFGCLLDTIRKRGFTAKPAVWVKQCPPPPGKGNWWPSGFEFAIYGYRSGAYFGDEDPKRCNVFWYDSYRYGQPGKLDHPTQKPLSLVTRLLKSICPHEGTVIDLFAGSGTTLRAAKDLGRRAIGVEIEEKYCEIAAKRLEQEVLF
jgi:site-specific DNA-methyltransferase (adenine-specific)